MNMNLSIVLTCEYIFNKKDCVRYLKIIKVDPKLYEYVYEEYNTQAVCDRKRVRKLIDVTYSSLLRYPNLLSVKLDVLSNEYITFPNTITHVQFNYDFNTYISRYPKNVQQLSFGHSFNQKLSILPSSVTHLKFRNRYNQKIHELPKNLMHLELGYAFKQTLPKLPNKLRYLRLSCEYDERIPILPDNLEYLIFGSMDYMYSEISTEFTIPNMPSHIKKIMLGGTTLFIKN
jgi:hypothetical protein